MNPIIAATKMRLAAFGSDRRAQLRLSTLPRIGGLASIPSRADDIAVVLSRIVPQVERLYLFLHGYTEVPAAARHPRVVPILAPPDTPYRASGKFYGLKQQTMPCLYFCFDDDILYPDDYVQRMTAGILRYGGKALVGIHGTDYPGPGTRYTRDRRGFHFRRRLSFDRLVDELGCGTLAFASTLIDVDPRRWPYGDMDDLMLAIEAQRQGIPRIAISRRRHSLMPIHEAQPDSLWVRTVADDSRQSAQLAELHQLLGRSRTPAAAPVVPPTASWPAAPGR
jgi:hypothetical protein